MTSYNEWIIYYDDGSTFSELDGTPFEAPKIGVQFVVQHLKHNKKYLILSGADFYTYQEEFGWWYCSELDAKDLLSVTNANQIAIKGRMIGYERHDEMARRVHEELPGKKDSWRHYPQQQQPGFNEVIGE